MSEPRKKKRQAPKYEPSDLEIAAWAFVGAVMAATKGKAAERKRGRDE